MAYFNSNNRSGSNRSFGGGRGRSDYGRDRDRQMYSAVCDKCGRDCQVPFKPSGDKPIYCSNCFEQNQDNQDRRERPNFGSNRRPDFGKSDNQNKELLASINSKLEKIIGLLTEQKQCVCKTDKKEVKKVAKKKTDKKKKVKTTDK